MSSFVILASLVFEMSCGKTDRQTDRQTDRHINASENPTHATTFSVGD